MLLGSMLLLLAAIYEASSPSSEAATRLLMNLWHIHMGIIFADIIDCRGHAALIHIALAGCVLRLVTPPREQREDSIFEAPLLGTLS